MSGRLLRAAIALCAGAAVGVAYPHIELALACREPASEACVWGKAYFSLTLTVSLVFLGPIAAALVYAAFAWLRRQARGREGGKP
ncbi:MAG TPA: hypothetical protein VI319_05395 [Burkholderiales bacterium]